MLVNADANIVNKQHAFALVQIEQHAVETGYWPGHFNSQSLRGGWAEPQITRASSVSMKQHSKQNL